MAKYLKKNNESVLFQGEKIKIDSKNRMYVDLEGKRTLLENIDGVIKLKEIRK